MRLLSLGTQGGKRDPVSISRDPHRAPSLGSGAAHPLNPALSPGGQTKGAARPQSPNPRGPGLPGQEVSSCGPPTSPALPSPAQPCLALPSPVQFSPAVPALPFPALPSPPCPALPEDSGRMIRRNWKLASLGGQSPVSVATVATDQSSAVQLCPWTPPRCLGACPPRIQASGLPSLTQRSHVLSQQEGAWGGVGGNKQNGEGTAIMAVQTRV